MTFVFDGMPSAGGPRGLRGRAKRRRPLKGGRLPLVLSAKGAASPGRVVLSVVPLTC